MSRETAPDAEALEYSQKMFPGDEFISPEQYADLMTSEEARVMAFMMYGIVGAARSHGLDLDPETLERWKRIGAATAYLDTFIDDSEDRERAVELYQQGIRHLLYGEDKPKMPDWAEPLLEPAVELLNNSVAVLPQERQTSLLMAAALIAEISLAKARCTDVRQYARILELEGQLSAVLVAESASDAVYHQPQFEDFTVWAARSSIFATFADSAMDLKRDSEAKLTSVKPHRFNVARIAAAGLKVAGAMIHDRQGRQATLQGYRSAVDARNALTD